MLLEAPAGVALGGLVHVAVAGHLGEDRGGGDRGAGAVAADHAAVRDLAARQAEAVDEADRLRAGLEPRQRVAERFAVGHVEAAAVDPRRRADHDAGPRRRPQHAGEHLQARLLGHLLGVVDAAEDAPVADREALVVEEDGGGDQRARQAAAPGLVGARDEAVVEPAIEVEEPLAAAQPALVELAGRP